MRKYLTLCFLKKKKGGPLLTCFDLNSDFRKNHYCVSRNFTKNLILALLARLYRSLKLCITNNTLRLNIMKFILITLSKIAITIRQNLMLNFGDKTPHFTLAKISTYTVSKFVNN